MQLEATANTRKMTKNNEKTQKTEKKSEEVKSIRNKSSELVSNKKYEKVNTVFVYPKPLGQNLSNPVGES